jgi:ribosomal protein L40E
VSLDLEQLVAEKVAGRLEVLNGTVETLVVQALNRELDARVAAIVQLYLEARARPDETGPELDAATKVCNRCGAEKPDDAFELGRRTCRQCRREQARETKQHRMQEPQPAVPFAGAASTTSRPDSTAGSSEP